MAQWRGLRVQSDPFTAYWEGKRLLLTRTQVKLLFPLVRAGEAESMALWSQLPEDTNLGAVTSHLSQIRKRFKRENVPVLIVNDFGHGYRLELEDACN